MQTSINMIVYASYWFWRIATNSVVLVESVASVNEYRKLVSCTASMKFVYSIPSIVNFEWLPNLRFAIGL